MKIIYMFILLGVTLITHAQEINQKWKKGATRTIGNCVITKETNEVNKEFLTNLQYLTCSGYNKTIVAIMQDQKFLMEDIMKVIEDSAKYAGGVFTLFVNRLDVLEAGSGNFSIDLQDSSGVVLQHLSGKGDLAIRGKKGWKNFLVFYAVKSVPDSFQVIVFDAANKYKSVFQVTKS